LVIMKKVYMNGSDSYVMQVKTAYVKIGSYNIKHLRIKLK
jgi:hypothetical protein